MAGSAEVDGRLWIAQVTQEADRAFERHKLVTVAPGHWRIAQPGKSAYWADIVVLGNNRAITVWGDIEACTFAYCSGATRPEQVVSWMAGADSSYYGRQKAAIGMGEVGIEQYLHDVACHDLRELLREAPECYGDAWPEVEETYREAVSAAIGKMQSGEDIPLMQAALIDDLRNVDQDAWEWAGQIGRVTSRRVIYALRAIYRLDELLQLEAQKPSSPEGLRCIG
jgi:hypothetical protein